MEDAIVQHLQDIHCPYVHNVYVSEPERLACPTLRDLYRMILDRDTQALIDHYEVSGL